MSDFDVHPHEMRGHPTIDDDAVEALLDGRVPRDRPDLSGVAAVLGDVRASYGHGPAPTAGVHLAELLAVGFSTDKGDPAATPASNVDGPAEPQVAGLPNWRRRGMVGTVFGTVAGKIAIACAAAVTAVGGVAYADGLPKSAQNVVSHAAETVGIDLPSHGDDSPAPDKTVDATPGQPGAEHDHTPAAADPPANGVTDPTATTEPGDHSGGSDTEPGDGSGEHSVAPGSEPSEDSGDHQDGSGDTTATTGPHHGDGGEHHDTVTTAPQGGGDAQQ